MREICHTQDSHSVDTDFFTTRPYRNFFQYPPINSPAMALRSLDALLQPIHVKPESDFTVFVSIPFCRVRCNSCPYFVSLIPSRQDKDDLIDRYLDRVERHLTYFTQTRHFHDRYCRAIYLGGGTASLMSPSQVERLLDILRAGLCFAPDIEITLEGNPHEFSQEYLDAVRLSGVTRVSIGYQSSQDAVLREMLNSPHTANESLSALKNALSAGFQTVNVDLLYRLPGQTFAQWQYDIEVVLGLGPTSVTTYEYIIHERTTSARRIADGRMQTPANKSEALSWYQWVRSRMLSSGYIEPTNHTFAKPGHAQRYSDLTYGQGTELIGLGVKAYSYVNGYQLMAPKTVPTYEKAINEDLFPITHMSPAPSRRNLMERYVIFSLRRGFGVSKHVFVERFGANLEEVFDPQLKRLSDNGTLRINESKIELSDLGREWKYNVLEAFYDPAYL